MRELKMKKAAFIATLAAQLLLMVGVCHAHIEKGLTFRSYEVSPDLRTSLKIPAEKEAGMRFTRLFNLAFDLRIDTDKECFGYVCRIIVDNAHNVDVVLSNPVSGMPYLGTTTASGRLHPLTLAPSAKIGDWNRVEIELTDNGETIEVAANGVGIASLDAPGRGHTATILFGTNDYGRFATSDTAPIVVRNIAIALHDKEHPDYQWDLVYDDNLTCRDRSGRMSAVVKNPEWLVSRNSNWRKIGEFAFGSKVFPVIDPLRSRILLVSAGSVTLFDAHTGKVSEYEFSEDICPEQITNDFIVLPDGQLIYYDLENAAPVINRFDFTQSRWQRSIDRKVHSKHLHHNKFFNPADSSVVQLFGYGFHRYLNEAVIWLVGSDSVRRFILPKIHPRYLSAVGVTDSVAYIYGGKGNEKGIQEFGATLYNDFYRLGLKDFSLRKLWDDPAPGMRIAASNLVVADNREHFTALFYSPNVYQSHLQLKEYAIADGQSRILADSIPYDFLDIDSDARLLFDRQSEAYYAVISGKRAGGGYHASVYTIQSPIIDPATLLQPPKRSIWLYLLPCALLAAVAAVVIRIVVQRRRKAAGTKPDSAIATPTPDSGDEAPQPRKPGIYLLGGFRVIDRRGEEITSNFTPVMRQLLILIILHSDKQKGISGAELKEALWSDKSEESYYNNRGVNIRKIRTWLAGVGAIEIASTNGNWFFTGDTSLCDYTHYMRQMDGISPGDISPEELSALIAIAHCGTLLPDMRFDWFDRFKANYTDKIIVLLGKIREKHLTTLSPEVRIRLADAVLIFDSLDEDSIRDKCRALIQLKRHGIAERVFNLFTQEYKRLLGEDYEANFNQFVKDQGTE